jgi:hypothetical protein
MIRCISKMHRTVWICVFALFGLLGAAFGADLPASVDKELQHYEQSLQSTTFVWKLDAAQQNTALSAAKLKFVIERLEAIETAEYRKNGIKDESQIQKLVRGNIKSFTGAAKQTNIHSSDIWQFTREHQSVLVDGAVQYASNQKYFYRQFYAGEDGLQIEYNGRFGQARSLPDPLVWQTSGDSVRSFAPVQEGLGLFPEHFAMLIGLNPLAMHNAHWSLTAATPISWVLKAQVLYSGTPLDVQLTLDRKHGNLPSVIQLKTDHATETFTANGFQQHQNGWICDKVVYKKDVPGLVSMSQVWTLQSLKPSKSLVVNLTPKRQVHDYRLIGRDLSWQDIQNNDTQHSKSIVYYAWPGHFPSLDILKKIYQRQNPGEASPDMGQAGTGNPLSASNMVGSAMPFAGGVLCLAGGVWMFKQRKAN